MFYTVYKTTHLESGKSYIGMHATQNPNDRYLGSGNLISRAIKKYGRDAFTKEVLFVFAKPEEMIAKEKELVTEEFALRDDTFNLNPGGDGSWYWANKMANPDALAERGRKGALATQRKAEVDLVFRNKQLEVSLRNLQLAKGKPSRRFEGKVHSTASREKMKEGIAARGGRGGSRNSQYGTVWVSKDGQAKKAPLGELDSLLEVGWVRGRSSL